MWRKLVCKNINPNEQILVKKKLVVFNRKTARYEMSDKLKDLV